MSRVNEGEEVAVTADVTDSHGASAGCTGMVEAIKFPGGEVGVFRPKKGIALCLATAIPRCIIFWRKLKNH